MFSIDFQTHNDKTDKVDGLMVLMFFVHDAHPLAERRPKSLMPSRA